MLLVISLVSATISCTRENQPPVNNVQEVSSVANEVEPVVEPVVVAQAQPRPVEIPPTQVEPAPRPQDAPTTIAAADEPAAEVAEDPTAILHGIWKTAGEADYNWARAEFRRGIPDGQVRQFARLQFNPNGTVVGNHGTFRYEAPSRNQVNHNNYIDEVAFTGTYSLEGNYLTISGQLTTQEIRRSLGDGRNARPRTSSDETRHTTTSETIHVTFNFREAGVISGLSYASGGTSFILPGIVYERQ